jgi:hypothetical protein
VVKLALDQLAMSWRHFLTADAAQAALATATPAIPMADGKE